MRNGMYFILLLSNILFEFSYHGFEFKKYERHTKYVVHTPVFTVHLHTQWCILGQGYMGRRRWAGKRGGGGGGGGGEEWGIGRGGREGRVPA